MSGIGNPFCKFNDKLSEYYKNDNSSTLYGMYVGNFYNHWKGSYNAKNYQWCLENYTAFHWAQNIANRGTYSAVCQGLVGISTDPTKNDLVNYEWSKNNFNPGTIMCSNGSTPLPFFNQAFLNEKNSTSDTLSIGVVAEKVGFPFRYAHDSQKGSYYVFDSKYDVVSFSGNESNGCTDKADTYEYYYGKKQQSDDLDKKPTLNYYYQQNQIHTRQNKTPQFLPLNGTNANGDPAKLDFGFGMRVDIPFYLTADGKQLAADGGNPMKFNFEGDDDVWVFIDGKLVLDLGGAHAKTKGSIDFSTSGDYVTARAETVAYQKNTELTTAGTDCFENDVHNTDVKAYTNSTIPVKKDAVHVLTVFYMERGMIESNLYMDFNFIPHNEEIEAPPATGDDEKTDSELTIKTKITFDKVATVFKNKVKELTEDDAFQYKIENAGTGYSNVQDSGIKYPSGLLSVRENEGKKTFWSYGKEPKIRIYFDLQSAIDNAQDSNKALSGEQHNQDDSSYKTTWEKPYIVIDNGAAQPMHTIEPNISPDPNNPMRNLYYYDVDRTRSFYFTNNKNTQSGQVRSDYSTATNAVYEDENHVQHPCGFKVKNGELYSVIGFKNPRQSIFACISEDATAYHPAVETIEDSINLPYETEGTSLLFSPRNTTDYNSVSNTSYTLTEAHTAAPVSKPTGTITTSNIEIYNNSSTTSGKTDSKGIFSLLSDDSATFLKQFRRNSNMRIVQQDNLGTIDRTLPSIETTSGPKVTVSKDSGYFKDAFDLTLTLTNATTGTYSINGGTEIVFTGTETIRIGAGCEVDDTVTVKVTATDGTSHFNKAFTYTKTAHKMYIRLKKSDFDSIPKIYLYDGSTELTDPFPGNNMAEVGNYYVYTHENIESATAIFSMTKSDTDNTVIWRSTPDGADGLNVSGYMEYDKTSNTLTNFTVPSDNVSTITKGTRKTSDYYYTTVTATKAPIVNNTVSTNFTNVDISKNGEFKFDNGEGSGSTNGIAIYETFTNQVKTGNLCISKKVTGVKKGSSDTNYSFTIKFKDVFGVSDGDFNGYALSYEKYDKNDTKSTGTLNASDPTITLKQNEKFIIKGIPAGTKYQIVETNSSDAVAGNISVSYETKINNYGQMTADSGNEVTVTTGQKGTIEGTIPASVKNSSTGETVNEFDEVDVNVTFTNQKGILRLEKLAIGEWKNFKDEVYTFTITGDDAITTYKYDVYEYNKNGQEVIVATDCAIGTDRKIQLKATQWALIQDIPLTQAGKTYTITETAGNYYKVNNIDLNTRNSTNKTITSDGTKGTISVQLSWTSPNADITYVNRYDPAYITISKYVDALYYQNADGSNKLFSDVTGDEITYQELTDAKQSFIFNIEEYNSKTDAENQKDKVSTFQITIPIKDTENTKESNKLSTPITFIRKTYRYKNSKTIKLTLGRFYRISEDTNWSWKYDLQGIGLNFDNTTGTVHSQADKYIIFEGGSSNKIPVINFYNTLTTDTTKLSTDGDTDVAVNIIKPTD